MKNNTEFLNHQEVMSGLTMWFRRLNETEINHRNMPNIINGSKAAAGVVTALHREEIMESRRRLAQSVINKAVKEETKKLKRI